MLRSEETRAAFRYHLLRGMTCEPRMNRGRRGFIIRLEGENLGFWPGKTQYHAMAELMFDMVREDRETKTAELTGNTIAHYEAELRSPDVR